MLNYPMRDVENNYSLSSAFNGNCLVSPLQARIYFDRLETVDDIFSTAYQPYVYSPSDVRFFNTTTPYSEIAYKKGFTTYREENEINLLLTGNINRRLNSACNDYLNAVGTTTTKRADYNGSVWFLQLNHYSMQLRRVSKLSHYDNGGLQNDSGLGWTFGAQDLPVGSTPWSVPLSHGIP